MGRSRPPEIFMPNAWSQPQAAAYWISSPRVLTRDIRLK
jgi:hypothetical protein